MRQLIREMSVANPLCGAPRIHGELLKLGITVGQTSVALTPFYRREYTCESFRVAISAVRSDAVACCALSHRPHTAEPFKQLEAPLLRRFLIVIAVIWPLLSPRSTGFRAAAPCWTNSGVAWYPGCFKPAAAPAIGG